MKVNLLETDDRFLHFKSQDFGINEQARQIIEAKPFGDNPYYIFVHTRQTDTTLDHRVIWQPRLLKPIPQLNSMLFRVPKGAKAVDVIWVIPPAEIWPEFDKGKIHENDVVQQSVYLFTKMFKQLSEPFPDDLTGEQAQDVMFEMYPLIFKRDTLPDDKKHIWDRAKAEKERKDNGRIHAG